MAGAGSSSDGPGNTAILLAAPDNYPAGEYCGNMTYGGFSDWYLPAIDELTSKIYPVKSSISRYENAEYWSSHEWHSSFSQFIKTDRSTRKIRGVRRN